MHPTTHLQCQIWKTFPLTAEHISENVEGVGVSEVLPRKSGECPTAHVDTVSDQVRKARSNCFRNCFGEQQLASFGQFSAHWALQTSKLEGA